MMELVCGVRKFLIGVLKILDLGVRCKKLPELWLYGLEDVDFWSMFEKGMVEVCKDEVEPAKFEMALVGCN